jgi:uncharacterized repeat protein (TIGR01451 family)
VAYNTYGDWHTQSPYFAEFDLYLDVDQDGVADWVVFNSDPDTLSVYVPGVGVFVGAGSPYSPYNDFNAGYAEWYLPASWVLDVSTAFDYQMISWDYNGNPDVTAGGSFDWAAPPLLIGWNTPTPAMPEGDVIAMIGDLAGYFTSMPKGVMVVDFNGDPRGAAVNRYQAYFVPIEYGGERLTIEKTVSPTVMEAVPNGVLTYTVTLANPGTEVATDVMMTDTLDMLLSFGGWVTTPPVGTVVTGNEITWQGTVPASGSVEFVFTATLPSGTISLLLAAGKVTNTAMFEYVGGADAAMATTTFFRYRLYMPLVFKSYP